MPHNLVLDIFYNEIINEAQNGKIDAYFMMNLVFNTIIENKTITIAQTQQDDIIVPTLKITNKNLFNYLLVEYVHKAMKTYHEKDFVFLIDVEQFYPKDNLEEIKHKYLIKYIIGTLFANASYIDFEDPITFLKNRISMLDNKILPTNKTINLGYLESINASIYIQEEISPIRSETPHRITSYLIYDDGYKLILPEIYLGKTNDKYLIYGIQKTTPKSETDESSYIKQIRKGLNSRLYGIPEHYFLTYILSLVLCNDKPVEIVPFLIERWNAKSIYLSNHKGYTKEEIDMYKETIQTKITNDFIRVFLKLMEVTPEVELLAIPFEIDDHLHISLLEQPNSKASIMNELYSRYSSYQKDNNLLTKK